MKLQDVKTKYIHFEDFKQHFGDMLKDLKQVLFYFTDVHIGLTGKYRSDDINEAIFNKLETIYDLWFPFGQYGKHPHTICGGDLFDVPKFTKKLNPKYPAINFKMASRTLEIVNKFEFLLNYFHLCIGNHDITHEPDVDRCIEESPILLFEQFFIDNHCDYDTDLFELKAVHWEPELEFPQWGDSGAVRTLVTHEPLAKGKVPYDSYTPMETYQTEADLVLTADIHTHQGVNIYNDTVFVSPGAVTRTNSSEKDKQPYFAILTITEKYELTVWFVHLLPKDDDPNNYWVDVRKTGLTDSTKDKVKTMESEKLLTKILQSEDNFEMIHLEETIEKVARSMMVDLSLSEQEIIKLKSI